MRAFSLSVLAAVLLAIGAGIGLPLLQQSSADAFSTSAVRLDRADSVNDYGRAG
jgi:hypothetical protein